MTTAIAQTKADVFSLATELAGIALESVKDLKKWCERNLEGLPASLDLRANKTWQLLSECLESHAYRMEAERRQDAALAEWEELTEAVEAEVVEEALAEWAEVETTVVTVETIEIDVQAAIASGALAGDLEQSINHFLDGFCRLPAPQVPAEPQVILGTAIPIKEVVKANYRASIGRMSAKALQRRFASLGLR